MPDDGMTWWQRHRRTVAPALLALAGLGLITIGPAAFAVAFYQPPQQEQVSYPHRLGEPVRAGKVTFVVHELRCGASSQATQGQLCEVTLGVRNRGGKEVGIPTRAQTLHVSQGARHLPTAEGTGTFGALAPGEGQTAVIRYDVPLGVTITHLELRTGTYDQGIPVEMDTPYPLLDPD